MRLPKQTKPVMRTMNIARIEAGIRPSDCPWCNLLPEPGRTLCRLAAGCPV